jgi:predicted dithiol-disulfide oxidoreductase (DUF899 family)
MSTNTTIEATVPGTIEAVRRSLSDAGRVRGFVAPGRVVRGCVVDVRLGGAWTFWTDERRHEGVVKAADDAGMTLSVDDGTGRAWGVMIGLAAGVGGTLVRVRLDGADRAEAEAWAARLEALRLDHEIDAAEDALRLRQEALAGLRKRRARLEVPDYSLRDADGQAVRLSEAFSGKGEMLLIHNMGRGCVYCTLWADEISGIAAHLSDRCSLVLATPDEPAVMRAFASSRGWRMRTLSTAGTSLGADMGFEPEPGRRWPGVSALTLRDGRIERVSSAHFGPGDAFCGLWHLMDLLERGGAGWSPKFAYQ